MPKNTEALKNFQACVDAVLAKRGVPNRHVFNENIRRVYTGLGLTGLKGWNKAKDDYLKSIGFANGYKSLLDDAKKMYAARYPKP